MAATRVAGLTAGVANRPLENDRQTRRSPCPARHEKHKRTKADSRWRGSMCKDCCARCYAPAVGAAAGDYSDGVQTIASDLQVAERQAAIRHFRHDIPARRGNASIGCYWL